MKREEQIEEAGKIYSETCVALKFPAKRFNLKVSDIIAAHRNGAEWADEHPKEGMVNIEDVCTWIKEHLIFQDDKWYTGNETCIVDNVIEDLRKYVKESNGKAHK